MLQARFEEAEGRALALHCKHTFTKIPIPITQNLDQYQNLRILPYSITAENNNISVQELSIRLSSSNGCCFYNTEQDRYVIYYNDTMTSPGRIRWTIAHELGHYSLGHLKICGKNSMHGVSDQLYRVMEQEADAFARELLAPTALVMYLGLIMPNFCPRILADCFGVSREAAQNITSHTHYLVRNGLKPAGEELVKWYKPYLDTLPPHYPTEQDLQQRREIEKALRLQGKPKRYIYTVLKEYGL